MVWLYLTDTDDGKPVCVNMGNVFSMKRIKDGGTWIQSVGHSQGHSAGVLVREEPNEIMQQMRNMHEVNRTFGSPVDFKTASRPTDPSTGT